MNENNIKFNVAVYEYTSAPLKGLRFVSNIERNEIDIVRISEWQEIEFVYSKKVNKNRLILEEIEKLKQESRVKIDELMSKLV